MTDDAELKRARRVAGKLLDQADRAEVDRMKAIVQGAYPPDGLSRASIMVACTEILLSAILGGASEDLAANSCLAVVTLLSDATANAARARETAQ